MKPQIAELLNAAVDVLKQQNIVPADLEPRIQIENTRDKSHGDLATNLAMMLAKPAGKNPRELAQLLVDSLPETSLVDKTEIAGPGFINFFLSDESTSSLVGAVLQQKGAYGRNNDGEGRKVQVEFVSANPTGPLHVGHARGAVFGDVLSRLLKFSGFDVTREYYWNDAGAQVDKLAAAVYWRYLQNLDGDTSTAAAYEPVEEVGYTGDYLVDVGTALAEAEGDKWRDVPEKGWLPDIRAVSVDAMKALIRDDLSALGVEFDSEVSESRLVAEAKVDAAIEALELRGLIYRGQLEPPKGRVDDWEAREQTLFRSTQFGDQVDRPLQKSDGTWTYFA
ncbi:arginine--tRNA ligase, partial [uncultured Thalassolituus sp.]|uniref:arginine--tRNA ligase domain-containing protein n=1 Tax=uncultured Thalassolituus sp. TaxID=285273 RepID=UPI00261BB21C